MGQDLIFPSKIRKLRLKELEWLIQDHQQITETLELDSGLLTKSYGLALCFTLQKVASRSPRR